ncbi:MAG: MFS transporter [Opitutae bacterium]|nr:MFS transporter [Opitutae bacterium]
MCNDRWRSLFMGIIEAGYNSLALLVAIRFFDASDSAKSLIACGASIGFLLAPVFLLVASKSHLKVSGICALCMIGSAIGTLCAASTNQVWVYTIALMAALVIVAQVPSLMVHVYSRNYLHGERGRRISGNLMISAGIGALTSLIIGQLLDQNIQFYHQILLGITIACFCAALLHLRIPSEPLREKNQPSLTQDLRLAFRDRFFAGMLFAWMLMGVGNLVTIPLRVEYAANPSYGINATNTMVLLITVIIPAITRVISAPVWAFFFDRVNLAFVRISINLFFFGGIFLYFYSQTLIWLAISSALIGWATGGGTLAWSLWVTKVAPPGRESAYMSVHSFFTGVRGVPAPFVGYWILSTLGPKDVAHISVSFIAASSIIFYTLASNKRLRAT